MKRNRSVLSIIRKLTACLALISLTASIIYYLTQFQTYQNDEYQRSMDLINQAREIYDRSVLSADLIPLPQESLREDDAVPEPAPPPKDQKILALRREYNNDDIVGFISIEGTTINYPVLQEKDAKDNYYYLERDINKNYSSAGSIFLDYENNFDTEDDPNTIIYGHNMNADIMFHSLRYYADEDFINSHKYITLNTLYHEYTWEIFAFYNTTTDFYYIQVIFQEGEFAKLLEEIKARSIHDTDLEVTENDRILTLSTCTNQAEDTRFVVNAKLISVK